MARRKPYTKVFKKNQIRAEHVDGMGDVVFKGFQCLNSECTEFIFVRKDNIDEDFLIKCPKCSFEFRSGEVTKFYDYELINLKLNKKIEEGEFSVLHDDYIAESNEFKYCIICNSMKHLSLFDKHRSRKSGRQGECRLCKGLYNSIKNQTRITDQHREAAQKRRMYLDLSGDEKLNSELIYKRFNYKCFKCGKDLKNVKDKKEKPLDHTLPIFYLWPLNNDNATLLCRTHNGEKSGKWPSEYYDDKELKELSIITGIHYKLLSGPPCFNEEALNKLRDHNIVDGLLKKYSAYIEEIIKLRNRILYYTKLDFFKYSKLISQIHVAKANKEYKKLR